ncbi:prolactin receptor-like isoform X2 [Ambystoma mexicanum]|uniref:prolactin receptor-like isoform X2 n=1 Tax=Ambystoma mexicanum TaxID=8296 RepID=UPI0037E954E6
MKGPCPSRPFFRRCRSANQETFTCWWSTEDNGKPCNANYTVTYTVDQGHPQECPDYTTGGDSSCYFDSQHTHVWELYCLKVVAHTPTGSAHSEDFCLDVIDIVEPDPPLNLSCDPATWESTASVLISWSPPDSADVDSGWMSLVYQLNFRPAALQDDWKIKGPLTETRLHLFDLAPGESYLLQVRCKPNKSGRWSNWSEIVELRFPGTLTQDGDLLLMPLLLTVAAFLLTGLGFLLLGERFKRFFLPPIPIPRISGIDSALLKKGHFDEIDMILMHPPLRYINALASDDFSSDIVQLAVDSSPCTRERETIKESSTFPGAHLPSILQPVNKSDQLHQLHEGKSVTTSQFVINCPTSSQKRTGEETSNPDSMVNRNKGSGSTQELTAETSASSQKSYMRVTDIACHGTMELQACSFQAACLLTHSTCQENGEPLESLLPANVSGSQDKVGTGTASDYMDCARTKQVRSFSVPMNETRFPSTAQIKSHTVGILDYTSVELVLLQPQST